MKDTTKAYWAGIVDGEAYIGITKTDTLRNPKMYGMKSPRYKARLQLRMVDERTIKTFARLAGVPVGIDRRWKIRPLFYAHVDAWRLTRLLTVLLPFLRLKRGQARLVLRLLALQGKRRWGRATPLPQTHLDQCEHLYLQVKALNYGPDGR